MLDARRSTGRRLAASNAFAVLGFVTTWGVLSPLPEAHAQEAQSEQPAVDEQASAAQQSSPQAAPTQSENQATRSPDPNALASQPGAHYPIGMGLSPEAPPTAPALGGRAPSFGAPTNPEEWTFRLTGRASAWESIGIGHKPDNAPEGYEGTTLHVPAKVGAARQPFWPQTSASLLFEYGNSVINATVGFFARATGKERQGYYNGSAGSGFDQANLTITPEPLGRLKLQIKVGAFSSNYAGPGQWGWGIFGPLLSIRGYGESIKATTAINQNTSLTLEHGVSGVPSVPEDFERGDYTGWGQPGRSTLVHHGHATVSYQNKYTLGLHYASAIGTDEREYLDGVIDNPTLAQDGTLDVYALESRMVVDPFGQIGLSAALWDFNDATAVHDGIWWGIKWTQGGDDFLRDYVGPNARGDGKVFAVSAQYDMSLARILWHPRSYTGNAPDVRVALAGLAHWTLATDDPTFKDADGFMAGTDIEYQMLSWFGTTLRSYAESRDYTGGRRWKNFSVSPGIVFRSDWNSRDRIEVAYTRQFYNKTVDTNPAAPLDRNVITAGATLSF